MTFAARFAGIAQAHKATSSNPSVTSANVKGSVGVTPNSNDPSKREGE
jgi:hypothetical protein